jgi:hypothetical protein
MPRKQQIDLGLEEVKTEDILNLIRMCDEALREGEPKIESTPVKL